MILHRWHPHKAAVNLDKHKVPFELAEYVFADLVMETEDLRRDDGEPRIQAYGRIAGRLFQCVYTWRDDGRTRWIISLRKANRREVRRYG
ncbi:MAG TPA: BrnT family toxin [Azospirillum sp.]